ncbi:MAG: tetratricopeptide repeat protein, partial [Nitrospirae bacterium]|nr:tetratricopeptide repeat protein [Nitrospirota bacterium]
MAPKYRTIPQPRHAPSSAATQTHAKVQQAYALYRKGQLAQAQTLFEEVLRTHPQHYYTLHLLGVIAFQTKHYQRALQLIDDAIRIQPNDATFYLNRGNALMALRQLDAALASFDTAIVLKPDFSEAYFNRGNALMELGQFDAALASYDHAIALQPDFGEAHFNKALVLLLGGNFVDGWALYEWRWTTENMKATKRNFPHPLWRGQESLAGTTILLHSEQGLGDTIQFCRYAPFVADLGARVILEVP